MLIGIAWWYVTKRRIPLVAEHTCCTAWTTNLLTGILGNPLWQSCWTGTRNCTYYQVDAERPTVTLNVEAPPFFEMSEQAYCTTKVKTWKTMICAMLLLNKFCYWTRWLWTLSVRCVHFKHQRCCEHRTLAHRYRYCVLLVLKVCTPSPRIGFHVTGRM